MDPTNSVNVDTIRIISAISVPELCQRSMGEGPNFKFGYFCLYSGALGKGFGPKNDPIFFNISDEEAAALRPCTALKNHQSEPYS